MLSVYVVFSIAKDKGKNMSQTQMLMIFIVLSMLVPLILCFFCEGFAFRFFRAVCTFFCILWMVLGIIGIVVDLHLF
jgi:hypothetical protein